MLGQQGRQLFVGGLGRLDIGRSKVHVARGDTVDLVVDGLQARQKLPNTETAESAAALDLGNVQGHLDVLDWVADRVEKRLKARAAWARPWRAVLLPAAENCQLTVKTGSYLIAACA